MNDIKTALLDPELGFVSFDVERITYQRAGGTISCTSQMFSAAGCIHPGTPEMVQLLPEEDRQETFIAVYTEFALSMGTNDGASYTGPDRIHYGGQVWRVVRVRDWSVFGYYQGYAVLVKEGSS
jgi:hypothetical protein